MACDSADPRSPKRTCPLALAQYGSGVIPGRFKEIRASIKNTIMGTFFDEEYLASYVGSRANKLIASTLPALQAKLSEAVEGGGMDGAIEKGLSDIIAQGGSLSSMLMMASMTLAPTQPPGAAALVPHMKPLLAGLGSQALEALATQVDVGTMLDVHALRSELDELMNTKLKLLMPHHIKAVRFAAQRSAHATCTLPLRALRSCWSRSSGSTWDGWWCGGQCLAASSASCPRQPASGREAPPPLSIIFSCGPVQAMQAARQPCPCHRFAPRLLRGVPSGCAASLSACHVRQGEPPCALQLLAAARHRRALFPQAATAAKVLLPAAAGAAALAVPSAAADGDVLHPAQYPWSHNGIFSSYDVAR